ncbi:MULTISPECIES: ferritin-like domain-containing protein [Streptomycetaceae]|uniref:Ferritin Dps family protein n=1 Tax=Streptantibioticus cattleyicolor (strain ATCC 35852 / DSM 46488 / JCM 4925 / NBRC 14057 / NRRL 8057) TaxID=1003195 RepID=F8JQG3_STREN|nr:MULTISPECIES: ferritin-like domain-containing protein [Streptomycetaceae]AEW97806.1 ferritin Dps family protein [Streptantibioticus cattleyicolor NRRL 8057 = DSM 46488]MYS62223.1 bacterioferritin [Streptomyces sp. SID5468]CCB78124.1 Bacterioferritin (Cytochrome b1) [Streptantibioticus cattleyicolor NRRL 8057 = DSM 46488]
MAEFLTDIETIRARARQEIDKGPVTDAYGADLGRVLQVLNEALATEIVCTLRYKRHYFTATGLFSEPVAAEFLEHAREEQEHADRFAGRIVQLGGEPDFDPDTLTGRAHAQYDASGDLVAMIKEDLIAERVAIAAYTEIAQWLGDKDPTTRRVFEDVLAQEEEHADDMRGLLERLPQERPGPAS